MTTHKMIRGKGRNGKLKCCPVDPTHWVLKWCIKATFCFSPHKEILMLCLSMLKMVWSMACRDFPEQCYSRWVCKNIQTAKLFFGQPIFLTLWNKSAHKGLFIATKTQTERSKHPSLCFSPIGLIFRETFKCTFQTFPFLFVKRSP